MTVYNAVADLEWTVGSDITTQLASFLSGTAVPGDTLRLDSSTRFTLTRNSGQLGIPAGVTISAVNNGGFSIPDTSFGNENNVIFSTSGANVTFDNVTVRFVNAPETGFNGSAPTNGVDYLTASFLNCSHSGLTIRNCDFDSHISIWVRLDGADDFLAEGSRFRGGKYTIYMIGDCQDARYNQCYFTEALIDCIKTIRADTTTASGWSGPRTVTPGLKAITNCAFVNSNRDAVDSTGGIFGWVCEDNVFINCGFDMKEPLRNLSPYTEANILNIDSANYGNHDIICRRGKFVAGSNGVPNIISISTELASTATTSITAFNHVNPSNILFEDCEHYIDNTATDFRFSLLKAGTEVVVTNLAVKGYTGSYTVFAEDYDAGAGQVGDAPAGWSPPVSPSSTGFTQTADGSGEPSPVWTKVEDPATGFVLTTGGVPLLIKPGRGLGRLV